MKHIRILFAALLFTALSVPAFADSGDDDMIVVKSADQSVSAETHDAEVIMVRRDLNGVETPAAVLVTDKTTGEKKIVGVGDDDFMSKLHMIIAIRLKFPELIGARFGLAYDRILEAGVDAGFGLFFNNLGLYMNVHPFQANNASQGVYFGGRFNNEMIWAIFGTVTMKRVEGVVGYRFDRKPGGFYSFFEAGVSAQAGQAYAQSAFNNGKPYPINDTGNTRVLPTVAFGLGFIIFNNR